MVTKQDILFSLALMGIQSGDLLLVHSSLSSIGQVEGGANTVIDALLEAIGPKGTLVMSTLTGWDSSFDAQTTPSAVGILSETFRLRPGVLRSLHPVHSVAALGQFAEYITEGHELCETGCGEGTPYWKIAELGGKILLLGVDMDRNTMMHTLEEAANVRYLRTLEIPAPSYQSDGQATFTLKKFPPGHRDFLKITPILRRAGCLTEGRIGQAAVKVIEAEPLLELGVQLLTEDPLFFICHNEHCNSCSWARSLYSDALPDAAPLTENHCVDPHCEICVVDP